MELYTFSFDTPGFYFVLLGRNWKFSTAYAGS